ncbi:MAG: transporter [Cytophagales bacterium]|nr:MAG: transporter [Cytophagales bacterium]
MQNIIFLVVCISLGIIFKKYKIFKGDAYLVVSNIILYICLPATTLLYASEAKIESAYILPILMPWILYVLGFLFFKVVGKLTKMHKHSEGVLIMTGSIPSVSFVGFPIFEMFYGAEGLHIGVLMSQAGSFLVCATFGVITASYYAAEKPSFREIALNVLRFPVFLTFIIAILMNVSDIHFAPIVAELLKKLAAPFGLLAMFSIGLQIELPKKNAIFFNLSWGLFFKLILSPLIIFVLFVVVLKQKGSVAEICLLGAALGPMNTAAIIASKYGLNPPLASAMVGIGIPISLIGVMTLYFLIH